MNRAARGAQRIGLGVSLRLCAVLAMGTMNALAKLAAEHGATTFQIVFFRNVFGFIPLALYLSATGGFRFLGTSRPLAHLIRAMIGATSMVCGFAALARLPLTEATAIGFSAPLFVAVLSGPVLGERVGAHRWAAVALGFCGVLIMLRPDPAHLANVGAAFGLTAALFSAGAMLAIRQLGATEAGPTIVFYFTIAATLVGAVGMAFDWRTPTLLTLAILLMTGLAGGVGQILMTQSIRLAPPAVITPFDYGQLLWAGLLGFFIWGELPRSQTLVGGLLIVACGLYILFREVRRFRRPAEEKGP